MEATYIRRITRQLNITMAALVLCHKTREVTMANYGGSCAINEGRRSTSTFIANVNVNLRNFMEPHKAA